MPPPPLSSTSPQPESLAFKKHGFVFGALLILLMNTLNYHLAYGEIKWFTGHFYFTFFNDLLMGLCAWSFSFWLIQQVQLKFFKGKSLPIRFLIQFGVVSIPCVLIIILWTELSSSIVNGHPVISTFYSHTLPVIALEIVIFTFIYMVFDHLQEVPPKKESRIELNYMGERYMVNLSKILFVNLEHGTTWIFLKNGERYTSELPLNKLEEQLEGKDYFRLNRQCISHRDAIASYVKAENKKLLVRIVVGSNQHEISISRTKAPEFKKWIKEAQLNA